MTQHGLIFVISAPAGTGKTTLASMLLKEFSNITKSVSYTTRAARKGEVEGKDYFFISKEEFEKKVQEDDFLENAFVFHDHYGTSKSFVEMQTRKKKHVVMVIDTQGALQLKKKIPAIFIFVSPPHLSELKRRLKDRKTENEKGIETRLSWAQNEMEMVKHYDYNIINKDLSKAYDVLRGIVLAEEHRIKKRKNNGKKKLNQ